jgi:DNA-binding beta-propeller fold protein YncE
MRFLPLLLLMPLLLPGSPAGEPRLFVADGAGNSITAFDPVSNRIVGTIPVSASPQGLAVSNDVDLTRPRRLYVSSGGKNLLDVVDLKAQKVVRSVPVGLRPGCVALSPDGRRVFVCLEGQPGIDVVDTANMQKLRTIELAGTARNLYITPDSTRMIAAADRKLTVINIRSEKVEFEIPVDGVVEGVAIESDKHMVIQRLFLQVAGLNGFEVMDYASRKVTGKTVLPAATSGLAVSPDQKTLWVSSSASDSVAAFSLPELKKVGAVTVEHGPASIACSASACYVGCAGALSVIDRQGMKELRRIPAGASPGRILLVE